MKLTKIQPSWLTHLHSSSSCPLFSLISRT